VPPERRPTLIVLAGPNGAGKSTFYETRVAPSLSVPFISAYIIQREELKHHDVNTVYTAAGIASMRRSKYLQQKTSFATESVFSHPSKLDLITEAKRVGYRIMVFHISVGDPALSVARVAERVKEGGHDVPEEKIRARYDRNGPLIMEAVQLSEAAHIFDNSRFNLPPQRVMSFISGKLSFAIEQLPGWVLDTYEDDLEL